MFNEKYILPQFKFVTEERANSKSIIKGEKFRITILTDRFFRFEYSESKIFYNSPTSVIWNRNFPLANYTVKNEADELVVKTKYYIIRYVSESVFNREVLKVFDLNDNLIWKFGDKPKKNLKGTNRTLDGIDGEVKLDDGLFSLDGYTIINDSDSVIFNNSSWFASKNNKTTDIYFFGYQNDYKAGLRDFYKASGYVPLIPRYALGNWWSKYFNYHFDDIKELVENFKVNNIPLSVFCIDMDWHLTDPKITKGSSWTGYTWNKNNFKNPHKLFEFLKKENIHSCMNLHPAGGVHPHEEAYKSFKDEMGLKGNNPIPFNITDPRFVEAYFELLHHNLEKDGADFFWIDWQQGTKSGLKNLDPLFALNHLHYLDSDKNPKTRGLILSRYPGLGGQRYPVGFSGDTIVSFESLAFQPFYTATSANTGFSFWSHDIGGHFKGVESEELYIRWIQSGVFSPILRLHSSTSIYHRREPWVHNEEVDRVASDFLRFRHKLIPYTYTLSYDNSIGGVPLCYPLYYDYPDDLKCYQEKSEYFFGSKLLVAPIVSPLIPKLNYANRSVYLPEGLWFDFFTSKRYIGGNKYNIYKTLREVPVYAKAGAIIPLSVLSKTNYIENPKEFDIHIFIGDSGEFVLYEDDGISKNHSKKSAFVKTRIRSKYSSHQLEVTFETEGELSLIPDIRVYNLNIHGVTPNIKSESIGIISEQYVSDKKTMIIRMIHEVDKKASIIIRGKNMLNADFDYRDEITSMLSKTTYDMELKNMIGFKHNGRNPHITGLLAKSKEELKSQLKVIEDKELRDAIKSFL